MDNESNVPAQVSSVASYQEHMKPELELRFTYHAPNAEQIPRFGTIRDTAHQFAKEICALTPPSREQSLALTKLDEVVMFANAAIARRENTKPAEVE